LPPALPLLCTQVKKASSSPLHGMDAAFSHRKLMNLLNAVSWGGAATSSSSEADALFLAEADALVLSGTGALFLEEADALVLSGTGALFLAEADAFLSRDGALFLEEADAGAGAAFSAAKGGARRRVPGGGERASCSADSPASLAAEPLPRFGANFLFAIPADQEGFLAAGLRSGVAGRA
jgi:hypothetical protein